MFVDKQQAIELAKECLLDTFYPEGNAPDMPLATSARLVEEDCWEVRLLLGEAYCFEVIEGEAECVSGSESSSKVSNWYYPDDRFNPDDGRGHPPAVGVAFEEDEPE